MEIAQATEAYHHRTTCRCCGSVDLEVALDLGSQPLANGLREAKDESPEATYPLVMMRCRECELAQLSGVVDPSVLYGQHYPYRSGFSTDWAAHCHALAKEIGKNQSVLEIGCLDGVMLRHCRDNGCEVQGVDPSSPVVDLPVIREFFQPGIKLDGCYDVIIAQNVFGHVDDARGFMETVADHLAPHGTAIIECPWIADLVEGVKWDTIYHEHLSYWGVRPMMRLALSVGLGLYSVKHFPEIHGGTLRYYLTRPGVPQPCVHEKWKDELLTESDWRIFQSRVAQQVDHWDRYFSENASWATIGAYGASAKLNVFLNTLPSRPPLYAVFDDTPSKIGKVTPGRRFPILAPTREVFENLDVLLVGASNWKQALEKNARSFGFQGEILSLWP